VVATELRVDGETWYPATVASARVRIGGFAEALRAEDVALHLRPSLTPAEYERVSSDGAAAGKAITLVRAARRLAGRRTTESDVRMVHRSRFPVPLPGLEPPARVDVYDFDDALLLGSVSDANRSFAWIKREAARSGEYVRRARLVIAANRYLAELALPSARRVEIVPSCVEPSRQPLREHAEREVLTIGWIGSNSTARYLTPLARVLAELNRNRLRARLVVVGGLPGFSAPWLLCRPWSLQSENRELAGFDIGVMPLPDDPWTRGKSGYKILQYFAAGLPVVASPVGVNASLVSDDRGIHARTGEEWLRALEELLGDVQLRRTMGESARRFVEADFSYARWAPRLAELFRSVA
jgi:glycosyltransferase involved in cell wall biosynthesis